MPVRPDGPKFDPADSGPIKAVAFLHAQGMPGKEIAQRLFPDLKDAKGKVSALLGKARELNIIRATFDEHRVTQEELASLRMHACRDPYIELQRALSSASGGCLKDLRVFYSGATAVTSKTWRARLSLFTDNAAWYVRGQLDHSVAGIAVAWGATIHEVIQGLIREQRSHPGSEAGRRPIMVIPTVGEPVGRSPSDGGVSSTMLARVLSDLLTGSSIRVPSLEGVMPVLPQDFDQEKRSTIRAYIGLLKGYRDVFGSPGEQGTNSGKLGEVDTILTGVGAFTNWQHWGSDLMFDSGIHINQLKDLCVGDLGGPLVPLETTESDPKKSARFADLTNLWTGITLDHFSVVASRAASSPAPGVVVCAMDANKARVVYEVVTRRLVNRLVVDQHLAKGLESLVMASGGSRARG